MSKTITSTELKQQTRKILKEIKSNPEECFLVCTHKEPQVVIISYETWQKQQRKWKKPSLAELKKHLIHTNQQINSTEIIKKMRDE